MALCPIGLLLKKNALLRNAAALATVFTHSAKAVPACRWRVRTVAACQRSNTFTYVIC